MPTDEVLAPGGPVQRRRPRPPELAAVVSCVWVTQVPECTAVLRVLPDAAVDLVFTAGRLVVAGPDTQAIRERLSPGPVLGFQLRPGAVAQVLGAPASALLNSRIGITEFWGASGRELQERLAETPEAGRALIEQALAARLPGPSVDPLAGMLRRTFARGVRLDVRRLGLGERQLRRRCVAAFGYPTVTLRRIMRFQRFMDAIATDRPVELAVLAHELGYSDQSDLTHQIREFSGLTPRVIRERLRTTRPDLPSRRRPAISDAR